MATSNNKHQPTDESARGISYELDNYVLQNVNITRTPIRNEYADQNGAIRGAKEYDGRTELTATVYSTSSTRTPPFDGKEFSQPWEVRWMGTEGAFGAGEVRHA